MKAFSAGLAAHLAGGVTTLATCWRVVRADGATLGFTDHDRTVSFEGVDHEPGSGLDATDAVAHAGLQVGGLEVSGAFASERIRERDLSAGLYDNARVETWLVNWAAPAERHRMRVGTIGEVKRDGSGFTAEVRGLAHRLDQEQGRLFRATCDADLGDARCGVAMGGWTATGTVTAAGSPGRLTATLSGSFAEGVFDNGRLRLTGGANAGRAVEVLRHAREGAAHVFDLWQPFAEPVAAGDAVTVDAGCDKRFATCRDRFANMVNFRGFPHMPGNDFALSYPRQGDRNSGGRLVG